VEDEVEVRDVQEPELGFLNEILVVSVVQLLKQDEGIVIHHNDKAYVVYNNSEDQTLKIMEDEDYLKIEHGRLLWMHYEGSTAPKPGFDEEVFGEADSATKH